METGLLCAGFERRGLVTLIFLQSVEGAGVFRAAGGDRRGWIPAGDAPLRRVPKDGTQRETWGHAARACPRQYTGPTFRRPRNKFEDDGSKMDGGLVAPLKSARVGEAPP